MCNRMDRILYYDCTNYYFEIEQESLKPLETKILQQFDCDKFIYCSDAGLASEDNRAFNHMGQRAFIVTQSIKNLTAEDRAWALDKTGFKRLSEKTAQKSK